MFSLLFLFLVPFFFIFAFVALAQGDTSKNLLLRPMSESILPVSFQKFKISSLTFKSIIYIEFIFVYGVRNWSRMGRRAQGMQCQGCLGMVIAGVDQGNVALWGSPDKLATLPGLCSHWHYQGRGGLQNIVFPSISNSGENSSSSLPTWHPFTRVNEWIQCTCSLEALQTTVFHCFPGWLSLHTSPSAIPSSCRLQAEGQSSHGYHISESPTHLYVFPLSFLVQKLFHQPSAIFQEQLLFTQMQIWYISGRRYVQHLPTLPPWTKTQFIIHSFLHLFQVPKSYFI